MDIFKTVFNRLGTDVFVFLLTVGLIVILLHQLGVVVFQVPMSEEDKRRVEVLEAKVAQLENSSRTHETALQVTKQSIDYVKRDLEEIKRAVVRIEEKLEK